MSLKRLFKSVGKVVKKVALPAAAIGASFLPGVGGVLGKVFKKVKPILNDPLTGRVFDYATSAKSARDQMAFQERLAGTSHQRELADLAAAGLNPILSGTGGAGAATTGGAGYESDFGDASSARQGMRLSEAQQQESYTRADNNQANTQYVKQQTSNAELDAISKALDNDNKPQAIALANEKIASEIRSLEAEIGNKVQSARGLKIQNDALAADIVLLYSKISPSMGELKQLEKLLTDADRQDVWYEVRKSLPSFKFGK